MDGLARRNFLMQCGILGATSNDLSITASSGQAAKGDPIWDFETRGTFISSPTVVDETVYAGTTGNYLYALKAGSGQQRWRFETDHTVWSSPAVVDGTVYVGSRDNNLYAVEAASGVKKWHFKTDEWVDSSPTVVGETVYVGSDHLYAVDASRGDEQWRFETGKTVRSSPTVVDGVVYAGSTDENLYAVDARNGDALWRFETGDSVDSSPTVVDGTVYVGSRDNHLYAVDASSGDERWRFETGGSGYSSPTVANGTVYIGGDRGNLYAVEAESGDERWRFETGGSGESSPTVVNGIVYVGSTDNRLYVIDAGSGEERWRFETGRSIYSSPIVVDGTVYIGSEHLYAIETNAEGSSNGSRALLGTLGHHETRDFEIGVTTETPTAVPTQTSTPTRTPTPFRTQSSSSTQTPGFLGRLGIGAGGIIAGGLVAKEAFGYVQDQEQPDDLSETRSLGAKQYRAREYVNKANDLVEDGELESAIEQLDAGIEQYELLLDSIPKSDDGYDELAEEMEQAEKKSERIRARYAEQRKLVEALTTAESHFQTAMAAPNSEKLIIPRERYRQAYTAYNEALELLSDVDDDADIFAGGVTISPAPTVETIPEEITKLPTVYGGAQTALKELDLTTLTAIQDADGDQLVRILNHDDIGPELAYQLTSLHWWSGDSLIEFTAPEQIERRRDQAKAAYHVHQS